MAGAELSGAELSGTELSGSTEDSGSTEVSGTVSTVPESVPPASGTSVTVADPPPAWLDVAVGAGPPADRVAAPRERRPEPLGVDPPAAGSDCPLPPPVTAAGTGWLCPLWPLPLAEPFPLAEPLPLTEPLPLAELPFRWMTTPRPLQWMHDSL
ncbi:hypothetical protein [Frankia sp. AgB32]|uniref:hypothetical protein n=1 Tax=Frankia sp. AgB32 TaxID=631119 RepID=UPI0034D3C702